MLTECLDVLIIGAGLSGIGVARRLSRELPAVRYAILEARAVTGGTWDLFRYPGVRSDSDMYTLGYADKPWSETRSMPPGEEILRYLREAAAESGVDEYVRLNHDVTALSWSSADATWTVEVERTDTGERIRLHSRWVFAAGGYYRYDAGFTPPFAGRELFRGRIVHPQHWPDDLDHDGRQIVVIGSGATAVTLVPALARRAALVTLLQRTPTYVMPMPAEDRPLAALSRLIGPERAYAAVRWHRIVSQQGVWSFSQRHPRTARRLIRRANVAQLPVGFEVDTHFKPPYDPWDQRLCASPDGDLFAAIRDGSATVVTDTVSSFTETGLLLRSDRELPADIVVTATGLTLKTFGDFAIMVDGQPVRLAEHVVYKGFMLDGLPNFAFAIGYTNASWTLKVELVAEHFCRLLRHLDDHGYESCVPVRPEAPMTLRPMLNFGAGYVRRSLDELPRQGDADPWRMALRYRDDRAVLRDGPVVDDHLRLIRRAAPAGSVAS